MWAMDQGASTSAEKSERAALNALIALVRLLARQAARDFVAHATDNQKQPQRDDR
jgi:hypothetical protein